MTNPDPVTPKFRQSQCGTLGNPFKKCSKGHKGSVGFLGGKFSEAGRWVKENRWQIAGWAVAAICIAGTAGGGAAACAGAGFGLAGLKSYSSLQRNGGARGTFWRDTAVNFGTAALMTLAGSPFGENRYLTALFVLPTQGACSSVQACARP
ncbi:unannotated protein [freshwater metagenome]|uniref:Unannotated protein n=1 Tax=freshwater metagenome TaxID=449393 RepID=A0A6J6Y913_9ZZZZ